MDPVLTARVLRLANSAFFGVSRTVGSLEDAILVLGFQTVRTLVVAGGLAGAFKTPSGFDVKPFWKLSLATAGYADWLARRAGVRQDLAFTGGLLLHIGVLLLLNEAPDQYAEIERAVAGGTPRVEAEESMLGFNHAEVGAELASRWRFPGVFTEGFKLYPKPLEQAAFLPLAGVFHLADLLARWTSEGVQTEQIQAELPDAVLERLGLDRGELAAALPSVSEVTAGLEGLIG